MSSWNDESIKKQGLERFTKNKIEYAIGKVLDDEVDLESDEAMDIFMNIVHMYHAHKMKAALKDPAQKTLFDEALL